MINKNFTLLWLSKIISQLGDKFYAIALAWWILQKTNSTSTMGFFLLVSILPGLLFGFFAGAMADRWRKKTILIVTDIIRGCLVLIISYLSMAEALEIWHVFFIGFCLSIVTAFFDPASQAIIPEIVEKDNLIKANGRSQLVGGFCTVAGPLVGALAVSTFGLAWVFFANSVSYFLSFLLSCFIRIEKTSANRDINKRKEQNNSVVMKHNISKDILEGIHFIKNKKSLVTVLTVIGIAHFFIGSLSVTLPFLANELKGRGVNNLGYLEMMIGIGLIAGTLFIGRKKKASLTERTLTFFVMVLGLCFIAVSSLQYFEVKSVGFYLPIILVIGASIGSASVLWQSMIQYNTPGHMTGRVYSVSTLVGNSSLPIAYGVFGVLLKFGSICIIMLGSGISLLVIYFYLAYRTSKQSLQNENECSIDAN